MDIFKNIIRIQNKFIKKHIKIKLNVKYLIFRYND